ncbi:hypothetical protein [Saccharothrix obliqua]|uniref:hypothetical protein n=1 Tax=Saccharothrix obliqua TaxID=2861747 RepID=UPI001C60008E|nr:hypothetical protein [Saccharothrix obliqua]MBW4718425.1 hypothetical protein [Saccharothrix obliqua]
MSGFKLGFRSRGAVEPRVLLDVFAAAYRLGFDGGWVDMPLTAPLVFLGAAAVRAPGLRLGAVTGGPDAAVLELGVDEPDVLRDVLFGGADGTVLAGRLWRSARDVAEAERAGRTGDGLVVGRRDLAAAYAAAAARPRFAVSDPALADLLTGDGWFLPELEPSDVDEAVAALSRVVAEVAPALGWRR